MTVFPAPSGCEGSPTKKMCSVLTGEGGGREKK